MFTEIKNKKIEHTQLGHMIVQVHDHFDNKNHLHHKAGLRIRTCHESMRLVSYLIHMWTYNQGFTMVGNLSNL